MTLEPTTDILRQERDDATVFRFTGELVSMLQHHGCDDAAYDLHDAWGDREASLDALDAHLDDPGVQAALIDGIRADAFSTGRDAAALLFATEHPAADHRYEPGTGRVEGGVLDEPYVRPMFEARTTGTKQLYTDIAEDVVDVRPVVPQDLPYRDRFDTAMRWCQAFRHNYDTLRRETPVNVPEIELVVADEPGDDRPWPYALTERIHGDHLQEFFDDPSEMDHDWWVAMEAYKTFNDAGRDLAEDGRISYLSGVTQDDFILARDGLYFVDAGGYGHHTDDQLTDSPHTPADWQEQRDPDHWTG